MRILTDGAGIGHACFGRHHLYQLDQLRLAGPRPYCEACLGIKSRHTIEIAHP